MPAINRHKNLHCAYRLAHANFDKRKLRGSSKGLQQGVEKCLFSTRWFIKLRRITVKLTNNTTSFPGLQCEDEGRDEEALVWAGHVSTQKMAVFDSYSSRSGEIFFNEIYKSSKQINSQKTSQSILFMCRAKFGTNQLKYIKTPTMFSKIYRYFWRFSTTLYRQSCIQANLRSGSILQIIA
jgi:hypothetical protein